ncbi:hypothetical protein STAS_25032 [Striga asiatica]|uniref:Uncharacterized protein n=1 Tax=Striga asiatica TaxID=4170 RepID=A0A5A7QRA8_STRAF|nr:hypothetical protein STAS_25032 [Striga asiatica]
MRINENSADFLHRQRLAIAENVSVERESNGGEREVRSEGRRQRLDGVKDGEEKGKSFAANEKILSCDAMWGVVPLPPLCLQALASEGECELREEAAAVPQNRPHPSSQNGVVLVGSFKSSKRIAVAVVDANTIIQGGGRLFHSANRLVSAAEVIGEIRSGNRRDTASIGDFLNGKG